jgi:hypothetical protein
MGARTMGMGNVSSCLQDEWALLNNPAGLSKVENFSAAFSYNAYPSFKSFNRMAASFVAPTKVGVGGITFFRFGNDLYSEQVLSAGFSNEFGLASLGATVNYIQYNTEGFGTSGAFTVSLGGIATLTKKLRIGAHIINVNQPKLSEGSGEQLPTRLTAGVGFQLSEKVLACAELEKDLLHKPNFKSGLEYGFNSKCLIRTGFNFRPQSAFLGLGFKPKKLKIDYAMEYNFHTGINHQASIGYKFLAR